MKASELGDATRDALTSLLPSFLKNRSADVERIREAVGKNDFETIARLAHNLRGNGASYGFPELSKLGERLEVAANVRNADAVIACTSDLAAAVAEIASRPKS